MTEERIDALERRLRLVEDQLAITQLVLAYGPRVDSGSADEVAALWAEDGSYEFQPDAPPLTGRAELAGMVRSAPHQAHLHRGCAHVLTAPHVQIDGDTATATCYSLMHHFVPDTGIFQVSRVSSNRWDLARTVDGWRVVTRTNRLLDGSAEARELFAGTVTA
jgi:hypothetical protein